MQNCSKKQFKPQKGFKRTFMEAKTRGNGKEKTKSQNRKNKLKVRNDKMQKNVPQVKTNLS